MKHFLSITALFLLLNSFAVAQEVLPKIQEFGIGFTSINSFSLQYRWGTEKRLYRLTGSLGAASTGSNITSTSQFTQNDSMYQSTTNVSKPTSTPINVQTGISFAALHLRSIKSNFGLFYGPSIGLNYGYQSNKMSGPTTSNNSGSSTIVNGQQSTTNRSLSPNVGLALGMYYKFTDSFLIYAEVNPYIFVSFSKNDTYRETSGANNPTISQDSNAKTTSFGISSLSNSGASVTLAYRITH